jgi:hypothetical protein
MSSKIVYVGVKAQVSAIDQVHGTTLWQTKLKSGAVSGDDFVTLLVDHDRVYAHTYGELYCLDAKTGALLWNNPLDGLGYGLVSLATDARSSGASPVVAHLRQNQATNAMVAPAGNS